MKTVIILSGGMDSATLLYSLAAQGYELKALGFNYGQRHKIELECARGLAASKGVPYEEVDLSSVTQLLKGSSQTDSAVDVPEGHYSDENMKLTVVPNRNMIMLSVAIGHAISLGYDSVAYGAHSGDHAIYPDCRSDFADGLNDLAKKCDWRPIELLRPFINFDKGDICQLGALLDVPWAQTWTCYKGQAKPCGKCGSCVERAEAFELAGVRDLLWEKFYDAVEYA